MPEEYDVVIVGGGPAGATASYLLRRQGLQVAVIDQSTFPRDKLCGGLLTYKTMRLMQRVYGDTPETLQKKHILDYTSNTYEIRTRDACLTSGTASFPFVLVERLVFDNYLLNRARELGVSVIEGDRVIGVDAVRKQVLTLSGRTFQADFIIGADGVNSLVRNALIPGRFNEAHWRKNLAPALEVFVNRADLETNITHPILYFGLVRWGYAWIFPNRDRIAIGVGGLVQHFEDLKASLATVLTLAGYRQKTLPKLSGHHIPYGNFLTTPVQDQILLVGDAAGLVDPFLGEGIYYALRSAELAARCILKTIDKKIRLDAAYLQCLKKAILPELAYIKKLRWLFFTSLDKLGYNPVKLLLRVIGNKRALEVVQGIRSYRWLGQRGEAYDELELQQALDQ